MNTPKRGVGAVSISKFLDWNDVSGRDIISGLLAVDEADALTARTKRPLLEFGQKLHDLQQEIDGSPAELIEKIMKSTGYEDFINDGTPQAEDANGKYRRGFCRRRRLTLDVATFWKRWL